MTLTMFPADIMDMSDFLEMNMPMEVKVVTNRPSIFGATVITYPGVANRLKELLGDFVIMPVSIHELLAINPALVDGGVKKLCEMVKEVNSSTVKPEEQLSDHVYKIDDKGNLVGIYM